MLASRSEFAIKASDAVDQPDFIPPFSIVVPKDMDEEHNAIIVEQASKPQHAGLIVTGEGMIPKGSLGKGTFDNYVTVAYDEADGVPVTGEEWGWRSGFYTLKKNRKGFIIVGGAYMGFVNAVKIEGGGAVSSVEVVTDVQCVGGELVVTYGILTGPGLVLS